MFNRIAYVPAHMVEIGTVLATDCLVYPCCSRNVAIKRSWRRSCSLRMMGFAKVLHKRSAIIVAARVRSSGVTSTFCPSFNHGKRSMLSNWLLVSQSFCNCLFSSCSRSCAGNRLCSISWTRRRLTPAKPAKRSIASGGAVHMRNTVSVSGFCFSASGVIARKSAQICNVC